jgi:hypothetical protein
MRKTRAIRYVLAPVVLVALIVLAMTLGSVWHNHANCSPTNCSICHLSHQVMERPLASDRTPALAQLGTRPDPSEPASAPARLAPRLPARAPPAV